MKNSDFHCRDHLKLMSAYMLTFTYTDHVMMNKDGADRASVDPKRSLVSMGRSLLISVKTRTVVRAVKPVFVNKGTEINPPREGEGDIDGSCICRNRC